MSLTAPDLILSLADSETRPDLSVAQLIAAGELFGIDSRAIRVALTRLTRRGVLAQIERGRYGLGPRGGGLHARVRGWQSVEEAVRPWNGAWLAVPTGHLKRSDKTALRARERALKLEGFAELETGLWLRPDNLVASPTDVHVKLESLGFDTGALVLHVDVLAPRPTRKLETLWNRDRLERGYRQHIGVLAKSTARLDRLPVTDAARETLEIGRRVTAEILLDPLLPEAMIDVALRRKRHEAMRQYNRLGRAAWRTFYSTVAGRLQGSANPRA